MMEGNEQLIIDRSDKMPKDWLIESIISLVVTLLSCSCLALVTAIVGVVYASKVGKYYNLGLHGEAASASNTAKILFFITIGLVLASLLLGFGMQILSFIMENR